MLSRNLQFVHTFEPNDVLRISLRLNHTGVTANRHDSGDYYTRFASVAVAMECAVACGR